MFPIGPHHLSMFHLSISRPSPFFSSQSPTADPVHPHSDPTRPTPLPSLRTNRPDLRVDFLHGFVPSFPRQIRCRSTLIAARHLLVKSETDFLAPRSRAQPRLLLASPPGTLSASLYRHHPLTLLLPLRLATKINHHLPMSLPHLGFCHMTARDLMPSLLCSFDLIQRRPYPRSSSTSNLSPTCPLEALARHHHFPPASSTRVL